MSSVIGMIFYGTQLRKRTVCVLFPLQLFSTSMEWLMWLSLDDRTNFTGENQIHSNSTQYEEFTVGKNDLLSFLIFLNQINFNPINLVMI
jgi:hypothetical protein